MPRLPLWRVLLGSAALFAVLSCFPALARAQAITILQSASLPRLDADGKSVKKRALNLTPEGVNQADCLANQQIQFPLSLAAGYDPQGHYEVWASTGADCSDVTQRTSTTARLCWPLIGSIPLQPTTTVNIPVRAIMAGAPPYTPVAPADPGDATMCGKVELINVNVQFMYFPPAQTSTSTKTPVTIQIDTVGPAPPTVTRVLPGNQRIKIEINNGGTSTDDAGNTTTGSGLTSNTGLKMYCDKSTGTTTAEPECTQVPVDAGDDSGEDAGTVEVCEDAGATTTTECGSTNLEDPVEREKHVCNTITGNTAQSITSSVPLENGVAYAVAVAATDAFDNAGELSPLSCETPEKTTDFWEEYREAGGKAGGGCSTTGTTIPLGSVVVAAIAAAAIGSLTQRRKRP